MKLLKIVLVFSLAFFTNAQAVSTAVTQANNDFGINLYKQLSAQAKGNVFISPYSIYTALSMAYAGANGNTKLEFEKAMGIKDPAAFHQAMAGNIDSLNQRNGKGFSIETANALWIDQNTKVLSAYTDLTNKYYRTSENQIDMSKPKASADKINSWVAEKTKDKIKDLISPEDISNLIITNAVYFKGEWVYPFEKEGTHDEDFTPLDGKAQKTPMMSQVKHFSYAELDGLKILELPYKIKDEVLDDDLSMVLILPDKSGEAALKATEDKLSNALLEKFNSVKADIGMEHVEVTLPKFKIETPVVELSAMLQKLGIKDAFIYPRADFSGINGNRELYISKVLHKAIINVDEEGTEAAAATAVVMTTGAMNTEQPKQFLANRPFLYLIRDNKTGLVLFIGKLLTPLSIQR